MTAGGPITRRFYTTTLTIANGGTTSGAFDARGFAMFQLVVPTLVGTILTVQTSPDGTNNWQNLRDNTNTAVSISVTNSTNIDLPTALASSGFIRFVSNAAETNGASLILMAKG